MRPAGEFQFPLRIKDLDIEDRNKYYVNKDSGVSVPDSVDRQQDMLEKLEAELIAKPTSVFNECKFDTFYVFIRQKELKTVVIKQLVDCVVKGVEALLPGTQAAIDGSPQERREFRNSLRMYIYLLCEVVKATEREVKANSKRKKRTSLSSYDWKSGKEKLLGAIKHILSRKPDVRQLWDMNKPEEAFASTVFTMASGLFEKYENHGHKAVRSAITALMAITIGLYDCQANSWAEIVRILYSYNGWTQGNEAKLASAAADLVTLIVKTLKRPIMLEDFLKEIKTVDVTTLSRDSKGAKCLGKVFPELANRMPQEMMKVLDLVTFHLDRDEKNLRSGVVQMLGVLLIKYTRVEAETEQQFNKRRYSMMEMLRDRFYDKIGNVRSMVLKTWNELIKQKKVPIKFIADHLLQSVQERLNDKAVLVRKQALMLLKSIIINWPLIPIDFNIERVKIGIDKQESLVAEKLNKFNEAQKSYYVKFLQNSIQSDDAMDEKTREAAKLLLEGEAEEVLEAMAEDEPGEDEKNPEEPMALEPPTYDQAELQEIKTANVQLKFLRLNLRMLTQLESALDKAAILLNSKAKFDVLEAIALFKEASTYTMAQDAPLKPVEKGYQRMLSLVWDKDNLEFCPAMLDAYYHKYFWQLRVAENAREKTQDALEAANKLVALTVDSTLADITCIEEMMRLMCFTDDKPSNAKESKQNTRIPRDVIGALWYIFGKEDRPIQTRRGALELLRMASVADPKIMQSQVAKVVDLGFGELAKKDPGLVKTACQALVTIKPSKNKSITNSKYIPMPAEMSATVWAKVQHLLHGGFIKNKHWFAAAESAIGMLFKLHSKPDKFCEKIIRSVAFQLFKEQVELPPAAEEDAVPEAAIPAEPKAADAPMEGADGKEAEAMDAEQPKPAPLTKEQQFEKKIVLEKLQYEKYQLAKFFFLIGHVAIKILVYIEEKEQELKKARTKANDQKRQNKKAKAGDEDQDLEEQLGMAGAEDFEVERLRTKAEQSLVSDRTLLGLFIPMIRNVILHPAKYKSPILQNSAVLAFCKFMCIDSKFCEGQLNVLFTLLKKQNDPCIKANIIIALGDMAFRFPNAMDAWNPYIYEHLKDTNDLVRKNTLMVLTHLILNDMIKVKDSIAEIALLLQDKKNEIRDLARLFFQELSKKGNKKKNPIYNILPDTISRLSHKERDPPVSDEDFHHVMKHLMEYVDGERQKVNLVEKLCKRFTATTDVQMDRRLAFCICQITVSEQVVKKLVDDEQIVKMYEPKLGDGEVWEYFQSYMKKCKAVIKAEFNEKFSVWEKRLTDAHEKDAENRLAAERAERNQRRVKKRKFTEAELEEMRAADRAQAAVADGAAPVGSGNAPENQAAAVDSNDPSVEAAQAASGGAKPKPAEEEEEELSGEESGSTDAEPTPTRKRRRTGPAAKRKIQQKKASKPKPKKVAKAGRGRRGGRRGGGRSARGGRKKAAQARKRRKVESSSSEEESSGSGDLEVSEESSS